MLGGHIGIPDQAILCIERPSRRPVLVGSQEMPQARVGPVGQKLAQLRRVGKHRLEICDDALAGLGVFHRPHDFDAFIQVAGHEIRAREEHLPLIAVSEHIDARMLEQTPDHADHSHVLGFLRYAGHEARDASHEHRHLDSRAAGLGDLLDDIAVGHGIRLQVRARGRPGTRVGDLLIQ